MTEIQNFCEDRQGESAVKRLTHRQIMSITITALLATRPQLTNLYIFVNVRTNTIKTTTFN